MLIEFINTIHPNKKLEGKTKRLLNWKILNQNSNSSKKPAQSLSFQTQAQNSKFHIIKTMKFIQEPCILLTFHIISHKTVKKGRERKGKKKGISCKTQPKYIGQVRRKLNKVFVQQSHGDHLSTPSSSSLLGLLGPRRLDGLGLLRLRRGRLLGLLNPRLLLSLRSL